MTRGVPSEHYRLLMSLRQSDEDVCPYPGETANRETLSPEVGRVQIALVATRRVIPMSPPKDCYKRRVTGNGVIRRLTPRANRILIRPSSVGTCIASNGEAKRFSRS